MDGLVSRGLKVTRGLVLLSCGPSVRNHASFLRLHSLVSQSLFDFVLSFGGQSTLDHQIVVPLTSFVRNVYIHGLEPWEALVKSFAEDYMSLDNAPPVLVWNNYEVVKGQRVFKGTKSRLLARSNFTWRPWGIDFWKCFKCNASMQYLKFTSSGNPSQGNDWIETELQYSCNRCQSFKTCGYPLWVKAVPGKADLVQFTWPLSVEQLKYIGYRETDFQTKS
ncbi:hypothetical protein CONPUDRAFT_170443 [Coniophora puteana RWD-64-598 SS2]|uniref:Uncharacterized protein n=1 Tax=Coniophora puteana (strain RWD-64-598) TaxID=741705 RepID=R7SC58_CONPW|nr:uncharacterized protein CONPUDRAFT_170443 [Coniophora puteana RWD-64-598 SS2]EIW73733.1 hypothetical protein CONPUDRAFT_170443 [Coniophora puteana RWD-64-598 SS2]